MLIFNWSNSSSGALLWAVGANKHFCAILTWMFSPSLLCGMKSLHLRIEHVFILISSQKLNGSITKYTLFWAHQHIGSSTCTLHICTEKTSGTNCNQHKSVQAQYSCTGISGDFPASFFPCQEDFIYWTTRETATEKNLIIVSKWLCFCLTSHVKM